MIPGGLSWVGLLMSLTVHAADFTIQRHDLEIELRPDTHEIVAQDTIRVSGGPGADQVIHLELHPGLEIEEVLVEKAPVRFWEDTVDSDATNEEPVASRLSRTLAVQLPRASNPAEAMSVSVSYRGTIHDAPTASPACDLCVPTERGATLAKKACT